MAYTGIKRKVFISHYKGDKNEVDAFIDEFANKHKVFTPYVLGANENDDFINSTIVLVGSCTHSRRYVDWELKSSLQQGETLPNGVMGIILPSQGNAANMPPRLNENWTKGHIDCYARYWIYPRTPEELGQWIEDAYAARTSRAKFIKNSQEMMKYNRKCLVCGMTH